MLERKRRATVIILKASRTEKRGSLPRNLPLFQDGRGTPDRARGERGAPSSCK